MKDTSQSYWYCKKTTYLSILIRFDTIISTAWRQRRSDGYILFVTLQCKCIMAMHLKLLQRLHLHSVSTISLISNFHLYVLCNVLEVGMLHFASVLYVMHHLIDKYGKLQNDIKNNNINIAYVIIQASFWTPNVNCSLAMHSKNLNLSWTMFFRGKSLTMLAIARKKSSIGSSNGAATADVSTFTEVLHFDDPKLPVSRLTFEALAMDELLLIRFTFTSLCFGPTHLSPSSR